jgi:uncharacterized protein (TIGR03435 family)
MRYLAIALFAIAGAAAQPKPDDLTPTFEAVSIKPFPEGTPIQYSGCMGGPGMGDPARIECQYTSLRMLLTRAYGVRDQQIAGPSWMDAVHFNIVAKVPAGGTKEQVPAMFRSLLAGRFQVVVHHENRMLSGYALTVAKGGVKMKESGPPATPTDDAPPPGGKLAIGEDGFPILRPSSYAGGPVVLFRNGRARLQASGTSAATLAETLSGQMNQLVADETGLTGKYDMRMTWTPDAGEVGGRRRDAPSPDASVPEVNLPAALEHELGLKLVSKKIERDTIVVDRAEKVPTEN